MTRRRLAEFLVWGGCAFILTKAVLSLVITPGDGATDGSPLWKLILTVSYLGVAITLLPYHRELLFVLRRNWFLLALLLLALLSFLWAETPALVLRRSIAVFGTTLLGIALAVRLSLDEQLRLMSRVFRVIAVLSLLCVVFLPTYGISEAISGHGEWRGIFSYKNLLGSIMALSFLVEWHIPAETRSSIIGKRSALLLSGLLLVLSSSITALVALIGSLVFVEIYRLARQRLRIPLYAIVLATLLMIASGVTVLVVDSDRVTNALGRSSDLTGRTEIWSRVLSYIPERPIWGYGYSGFWSGASSESVTIDRAMGTMIMYSHNGYLEILLNLGAAGLFLTFIFLGTGMKRAYYCSELDRSRVDFWPLAFLFFFVFHNIGECTILFQDLEWALCVAVVVSTDPAVFLPDVEQDEALLFTPAEEFV